MLGGFKQRIVIRGKDKSKPVLLMLHGGPGGTFTPFINLFHTSDLEENFVVVHWDQRGAGASYNKALIENDMKVESFIEDTRELTALLIQRFVKTKIFMVGHSWGSALGFLTIGEYPELYHAYIGVAEAADWDRRQQLSFDWALEQATSNKNTLAIQELESVKPFDPKDMNDVDYKDKWLAQFGGYYKSEKMYQEMRGNLGKGPEYSEQDVQKFIQGLQWSSKTIGITVAEYGYSLFKKLPKVKIPVYIFAGRLDYQTPGKIAKEYFDMLDAPKKGFVWFENSAHMIPFSEPEKFSRELIKIAKSVLSYAD